MGLDPCIELISLLQTTEHKSIEFKPHKCILLHAVAIYDLALVAFFCLQASSFKLQRSKYVSGTKMWRFNCSQLRKILVGLRALRHTGKEIMHPRVTATEESINSKVAIYK